MLRRASSVLAVCLFIISVAASGSVAKPMGHDEAALEAERRECSNCHHEKKKPKRYDAVRPWLNSRHAEVGVTCIDCHLEKGLEADEFYKARASKTRAEAHASLVKRPGSIEMKSYFVGICGGCHEQRLREFKASVHGDARLENGVSVSCIDCHDPHRAPLVSRTDSKLYRGADLETCGRCHKGMLASYMKTFHGKQFTLGNTLVPTCTYCHIGHEPAVDDPGSTLHAESVGSICAGCHGTAVANGPGADAMMIHNLSKDATRKVIHFKDPVKIGPFSIAAIINSSYLSMIIGVVGFFTLLSTRDFIKKTKMDHGSRKKDPGDKRSVKRFSISWRLQHLFWALAFIVLAATGLSLKFPNSIVSRLIVWVVGGAAMRSYVHRTAAVVFIVTAILHLIPYILLRRSPRKMLLTKKDFLDALLHISYLFDRTEKMPLMGRYTWYQKLEYWATVMGGAIVVSTGLLMWGFAPLVKNIPIALVYYAQLIHGWEAILAVLVICVQHLYHTILNPLVFPMDFSWLTGRSSYVVMEHEHPLELMEIESAKGGAVDTDRP
jgi:formate dehydrogenase gamma subunit